MRARCALLLCLAAQTLGAQVVFDPGTPLNSAIVTGDRGAVVMDFRGLSPNAPIRFFHDTAGDWSEVDREAPSNPGDAFHALPFFTERFDWWGDQFDIVGVFTATASDGSPVDLRVRDQFGIVRCLQRASSGTAICRVRIPHSAIPRLRSTGTRELTLSVEAEARGRQAVRLRVAGFWQPTYTVTDDLELQGPVRTNERGEARVVMPYVIRRNRAFAPNASLISVRDGSNTRLREAVMLIARDGSEQVANLALVGAESDNELFAGTSHADLFEHRKLVFLVPGNVGTMKVSASTSSLFTAGTTLPQGTPQDLALSLHRWAREPTGSDVISLPAGIAATHTADDRGPAPWPAGTSETLTLDGRTLAPGLWYAVPRSKTGVPLNVHFSVEFGAAASRLDPRTGHYFNPDRPGHGMILAPAGNDWVLIWYTFDDTGHPTWYYAQAPKPNAHSGGSQWFATLYRNVWDGSATRFQFAGFLQIAVQTPETLLFAHMLNGKLGVEPMTRLGDGRCTQRIGGEPLDVNGLWYSPSKSGYGYSIEFIGGTEFYLAYAYDASGMPRWVTAQQTQGARTFPLWQVRGSCPSCPPLVSAREQVGTFERTLGAAAPDGRPGFLSLGLDVSFTNGVFGRWTENRPAELLSRRAGCE